MIDEFIVAPACPARRTPRDAGAGGATVDSRTFLPGRGNFSDTGVSAIQDYGDARSGCLHVTFTNWNFISAHQQIAYACTTTPSNQE